MHSLLERYLDRQPSSLINTLAAFGHHRRRRLGSVIPAATANRGSSPTASDVLGPVHTRLLVVERLKRSGANQPAKIAFSSASVASEFDQELADEAI